MPRRQAYQAQRYSKRAVKGNTQIKPQMNECTEKLSRQATLKHKVWCATKANFIKFTTRRSEAVGCSHESRRSSNAQKTARVDFCGYAKNANREGGEFFSTHTDWFI